MMRYFKLLWVFTLIHVGNAAVVTTIPNKPTPTLKGPVLFAITPTTAGQIGINPVTSDLGDPDTYVGQIHGTDTQYITQTEAKTKVSHISAIPSHFDCKIAY